MSTLENAIILACKKHRGQIDCHGQPYILHLLRIMLQSSSPQQQLIAILQDILSHSDTTVVDLISMGFSNEVIDALLRHQQKHAKH
ncbi:hypothetical protein [Acinetobacter larvae]|uniref:Uncharacterized protein n=1 Tax=Acinetobacter larvae TaxID=1789224 RepID=A0A1B2M0R0_9GAMM|nr:hypothetical protein [Acinetobacter larvae]AOA58751.1 hypothetical protein BFG52_10590 [Acinetobacter larvae]